MKSLMLEKKNSIKFSLLLLRGMGSIIATSTSKIKKTTVIIKNRREKELRILCSGSNPHSNALSFSRVIFVLFVLRIYEIITINMTSDIKAPALDIIIKIFSFQILLIGNQLYLLY